MNGARVHALLASMTLLLCVLCPPARGELVTALSNNLVAVTTGFTGTSVLLFGTTDGTGDVVVVVSGPEAETTVLHKGRRFGIWVNDAEMTFAGVPGFWAIASSRPLTEILPDNVAALHAIGLDYLPLRPVGNPPESEAAEFRAALIATKQRLGLYSTEPGAVSFLGGRLFRTDIRIPANAPIGTYMVTVFLVEDNDVVSAERTPLVVGKVGFEARVYDFAHRQSFAYGVLAVVVAACAGWCANLAFRRG